MKNLLLTLSIIISFNIISAQIELDTTLRNYKYFYNTSIVYDSIPGIIKKGYLQNNANLIKVLPDSKFVTSTYNLYHRISRFLENGKIDTSFGTNGYFESNNSSIGHLYNLDMEIYQGNIYVLCRNSGNNQNSVFALNSSGQLISSFGTGGVMSLPVPAYSSLLYSKMTISNSGDIYLGNIYGLHCRVCKINSQTGILDNSFGINGVANNILGGTNNIGAEDIIVNRNDEVIVVGSDNNNGILIVKLLSNGNLDLSFNSKGSIHKVYSNNFKYYQSCEIHFTTNNRILISGDIYTKTAMDRKIYSLRINQNGSTDNTYGTSGWSIVDFGIHANSTVSSVLRNNGKLVVSSMYRQFLGAGQNLDTTYFGILQLDSNGTLDYSFAPSGVYKQTINFRELSSRYDEVRLFSSSLAPNNKIILVGAAYDCKTLSSCIFDGLAARFHLNSNKKQYTDMEKMDKQKLLVFVYPNPFEKEISIQIDDNSENLIIQIVDVSGKIVFYESGTFTSKKITIRDISKGIYFLKINTSDGKRSEIKRIVKI